MRDDHALGQLAIELADAKSFQQSVSQVVACAAQTFETAHAGITLIHNSGKSFETAGPTDDVETAQVLAYHASAALRTARQIEGLTIALDSRTIIGQAQGILMERYKVDSDRAFAILRRHSQQENIRLNYLARELVETSQLGKSQQSSDA